MRIKMNKLIKGAVAGALVAGVNLAFLTVDSSTAMAKTTAAKVISSKKIHRTAYYPNGGTLYTSKKLTTKSAKSFKVVKTALYATKSAKLKRATGKKVTYYYVKNKRGSVKGWIGWGYLSKTKNLAQRRSDMRGVQAAVRWLPKVKPTKGMTTYDRRDDENRLFKVMKPANAYKSAVWYPGLGLPDAIAYMYATKPKESRAILEAYNVFKGRFDKKTNAKLAKLSKRVEKKVNISDTSIHDDQALDASESLIHALKKAVKGLD